MSFRSISAGRNKLGRIAALAITMASGQAFAQPAGEPGDAARHPYVAALARDAGNDPVFFCAGALIAPRWIATAAHCFHNRDGRRIGNDGLWAVVGRDRLDRLDIAVRTRITRVIIHPAYDPTTQSNDIALVRLDAITGSRPIAIARERDSEPSGSTALGFGSLYEGRLAATALSWSGSPAAQASSRLRRAQMWAHDPRSCLVLAGRRGDADMADLLCVGADPIDACVGDSGAPLIASSIDGEDRLIGVLSLGSGCAVSEPVLAYLRIADYARWIDVIVAER